MTLKHDTVPSRKRKGSGGDPKPFRKHESGNNQTAFLVSAAQCRSNAATS